MQVYDINGSVIVGNQEKFCNNISIKYAFDETSHTNYTVFRINKKRIDGSLQFPFVRWEQQRTTAINLAISEGWLYVSNGGVGTGLLIENSVVIQDDSLPVEVGALPLSIDRNGDLGYLEADTIGKGQTYVDQGIVSAVCGFFPVIVNYENFEYPTDIPETDTETWQHAQRQIIGQFGNGDYLLIVSEGRGYDNSVGFTMADVQRICKDLGVKFAYNLDGGGSTQTVIGKRNINTIYEGTSGRLRTTFIVFNGTNKFEVPNVS